MPKEQNQKTKQKIRKTKRAKCQLNTSHFLFYTYNPPTIKSKQSPFAMRVL